jgi:Leucine-rich repeat (LRR) protein
MCRPFSKAVYGRIPKERGVFLHTPRSIRGFAELLLIALMLTPLAPGTARAAVDDAVDIPDPALRAALESVTRKSPVTKKSLAGLTGTLDLAFSDIRSLTGLEHATGVTQLLLAGNAITDITPLMALPSLKRLDLDYNPIASLPGDLSGLAALTELHLGRTRLTAIPEAAINSLPSLRRLYLEELILSNAPRDLSGAADTLNRLFIGGTVLADTSFLAPLVRLELLDMRECGLRAVPPALQSLEALRYLYMQHNEIESLPDWFGSLGRLERLDLTGNRLGALPASMARLTKLRHMVLSDNALFALPGWITGLTALEVLLVSDNYLTAVPEGFHTLRNLYRFSFQNNSLRSIAAVGRIPVGYPYQVSFKYNLLNLKDDATNGLLRYYGKGGTEQKTPITARIVSANTDGVHIESYFDMDRHDPFLEGCTVGPPLLYRMGDDGVYRLAATGEYSRERRAALVKDSESLAEGMRLTYWLVIPVTLSDGTRVSYQASAKVETLAAAPTPTPGPSPAPGSGVRRALPVALAAAIALAASGALFVLTRRIRRGPR